jgi:hypothetical protein
MGSERRFAAMEPAMSLKGIWGLDDIGQQIGNEVPLFEMDGITIYRIVHKEQTRVYNWAFSPSLDIRVNHVLFLAACELRDQRFPTAAIYGVHNITTGETYFKPQLPEHKEILDLTDRRGKPVWIRPYTAEFVDEMNAKTAKVVYSFLLKWLDLKPRQIYEPPWYDKAWDFPSRVTSSSFEREVLPSLLEDLEVANEYPPDNSSESEAGHLEVCFNFERFWEALHGAFLFERTQIADENGGDQWRVYEDRIEHLKIGFRWDSSRERFVWRANRHYWHDDLKRIKLDKPWHELPIYDTYVDALIGCGWLALSHDFDKWLRNLPEGRPIADIEFFKVFGKELPPVSSLDQFLFWAAKEGILPWSPLDD